MFDETIELKGIQDILLYFRSFDENNMFDFDHINKLFFVSEVLSFEMYHRIEKNNLNYFEDDILDFIDLQVKTTDMFF